MITSEVVTGTNFRSFVLILMKRERGDEMGWDDEMR